MPTYDFYNTETEEVFERFMTISAKEEFLEENPHITQKPAAIRIVSGVNHNSKLDDGFNERLAKIGEAHPNSPVGEKFRKNKTIKEVKTQEVVKKHLGK